MGDWLEVIVISSVGMVMTLILRSIFPKQFHVFWRKLAWLFIAVRMLIVWNPSFLPGSRLHFRIIPMSSYNDLIIMNMVQKRYQGMPDGIFYETPLVWLVMAGIFLVSVIKIILHHEEYGFVINKLADSVRPLKQEDICTVFLQAKEEVGIRREIPLYSSVRVSSPMIIGCIHVGIILPEKLVQRYQDKEIGKEYIRCVLLHELVHFQKKDVWYKRLMLLVNDLYWFHPLVYIMRKAAIRDLEFCCDRQAVKHFDREQKMFYCHILLDFINEEKEQEKFRMSMSSGAGKAKERIDYVMEEDIEKKGVLFFAGILAVMLMTGSIQIENNPDYPFRLINFSDQFMTEILHVCEITARQEFGITVTVTYENDLERNIWTQEELQNSIHVNVFMEGANQDLQEQEEKIRKLINSYFGVTMDVAFCQEEK